MQPESQMIAEVVNAIRTSARLGSTIRVTPDSRLAEDLAIDSLGLVRLTSDSSVGSASWWARSN